MTKKEHKARVERIKDPYFRKKARRAHYASYGPFAMRPTPRHRVKASI